MEKADLYKALYTSLSSDADELRKNCLQTLLGIKEDVNPQLDKTIERYHQEEVAISQLQEDENTNEIEIIPEKNLQRIINQWSRIHNAYCAYLNNLTKKGEIDKILIYEAPPMPDQNGNINYILFENSKGSYADAIKSLDAGKTILEILLRNNILFIDLCPLPLPLTSKIRKNIWGREFCKKSIGEECKPLSVVLLELALEFVSIKGIELAEKPIIAMGAPTATSQSIYYYFAKNRNRINNIDFSSLTTINSDGYDSPGEVLPLYKSNFQGASNTPSGSLLKRIFNLSI
jgi:hypothetical protein